MKIMAVCQNFYPENFQINDICRELVSRGHSVTVLTGLPNYPTGIIPDEYRKGKKRDEYIDGIHVIRSLEIGRKKGVVGLAINYISFCLSASLKALKGQYNFDIIYVYQLSPILMAIPALILKRKYKKPIFLYCCDIWPESMKVLLKRDKSLIYRVISRLSTHIYRQSDKIAVQSKAFFSYFDEQHGIRGDSICYIPQFADEAYLDMDFSDDHEGVNFVFLGNIGIAQDMECILKAVSLLKEEPFMVHIVGDGSFLEESKHLTQEYHIEDKVVFYGRRPVEEMPKFYKFADACLLTLKDDLLIGHTIPLKLQGYMAAGKPVLGAINGAAQDIIRESGCGMCVCAGDYEGLAKIMMKFMYDKSSWSEYGENGRCYFTKNFTQQKHMDVLESELNNLIESNSVYSY